MMLERQRETSYTENAPRQHFLQTRNNHRHHPVHRPTRPTQQQQHKTTSKPRLQQHFRIAA